MIASRVHSASHSSMLWLVSTTVRPAQVALRFSCITRASVPFLKPCVDIAWPEQALTAGLFIRA